MAFQSSKYKFLSDKLLSLSFRRNEVIEKSLSLLILLILPPSVIPAPDKCLRGQAPAGIQFLTKALDTGLRRYDEFDDGF
jgi:hypothetical protein